MANWKQIKLKNVAGTVINPATEDKQDDVIANQTDGSQKIQLTDVYNGVSAKVDGLGQLKTIIPFRLIGTAFSGTTKDTNFWTETVTGSGAVAQSGEVTLTTGTTADSTAKYATTRKARKITGAGNQFRFVGRLTTNPQANNLRRCGAYDVNNGFFFQVNGTTFGIGVRKATTDTIVNSGSFNGNMGASVTLDTSFGRYFIEYDHLSVKFFVNDVLLHTVTASTTALTDTLDLPITMENNNSGGNITNNGFEILFACVLRLGNENSLPQCYYAGTAATTVLKYGAGKLLRITICDNTGTLVAYDNTAGSGAVICNIDAAKTVGTLEFDCPFNNGLTIVTVGSPKMTCVYE